MSELLHGSPVHKPITSFEILEWAAELKIRNDDEREAYDKSRTSDDLDEPRVMGDSGGVSSMDPEVDAMIVREARKRGFIE